MPGSYTKCLLADPNYVGYLPDNLSFQEVAPLRCTDLTDCTGFKETEVKSGQGFVIYGIGGLGHLAVQ